MIDIAHAVPYTMYDNWDFSDTSSNSSSDENYKIFLNSGAIHGDFIIERI
jgi:hypothetical protein